MQALPLVESICKHNLYAQKENFYRCFLCCAEEKTRLRFKSRRVSYNYLKYSLQGTTQGNGLTGGVPPVRFSM